MQTFTTEPTTTTETFARQCAWCWRAADAAGDYTIPVGHNLCDDGLSHVSHGICDPCMANMLGQAA